MKDNSLQKYFSAVLRFLGIIFVAAVKIISIVSFKTKLGFAQTIKLQTIVITIKWYIK